MISSNSAGNSDDDPNYSPHSADDDEDLVDNSDLNISNNAPVLNNEEDRDQDSTKDPTDQDEDSMEQSSELEVHGLEDETPSEREEGNEIFDRRITDIFDTIAKMTETEIGIFPQSNDGFLALERVVESMRRDTTGNDFSEISIRMLNVLELYEIDKLVKTFRGIYEFIIHIHNVYQVELSRNNSIENNQLLVETMETAFRKCM